MSVVANPLLVAFGSVVAFAALMFVVNQAHKFIAGRPDDRLEKCPDKSAEPDRVPPDRVPLIKLKEMAADAGFDTNNRMSMDAFDLVNRLNQAAVAGVVTFWGRKYEYDLAEGAKESVPLQEIFVKHLFDGYQFNSMSIFGEDSKNFYVHTGKLGRHMREQRGEIYNDIYADRHQLVHWFERYKRGREIRLP